MLSVVLHGWLATVALGASAVTLRPITQADMVVAVYTQDWGLASSGEPKLVLAAWNDGRIVWSENRIEGGEPYLAGQIVPARVAAVLERADKDGVFQDQRLTQACFGPDSRFTTIFLKNGTRQLRMDSWHELFEANGAVVSSCALRSLAGERRLEVLRKEPTEYLYYRVVWGELHASADSLIPTDNRPATGQVVMKAGVLSWHEGAPK